MLIVFVSAYALTTTQPRHERPEPGDRSAQQKGAPEGRADPNDRIADYTFWLTVFTAALASFSVIEIWILIRTEDAMRKSIDIARQQMQITGLQTDIVRKQHEVGRLQYFAANRPRLRIRDVYMLTVEDQTGERIWINFRVVNTGATPANIYQGVAFGWITTGPLPWPRRTGEGVHALPTQTIGEGQVTSMSIPTDYTAQSLELWHNMPGGFGLYLIGSLTYTDATGSYRETGFARRLNRESSRFTAVDDPEYEYED